MVEMAENNKEKKVEINKLNENNPVPPPQTPAVTDHPAKNYVPVPNGKDNKFLNIVLTLSLLIIVFVIAFIIAYQYQKSHSLNNTQVPTPTPSVNTPVTPTPRQNPDLSCSPLFEIVSGPELTASGIYAQECFKVDNRQECEEVDVYNAENDNFGDPDGTPDCQWKE